MRRKFLTALLLGTSLSTVANADTYTYDENGRLIKEESASKVYTYTYNDQNLLVSSHLELLGSNPMYAYRDYVYEYDEFNNLIKTTTIQDNGISYSTISSYTYDEDGNKLNKKDSSGNIIETYTYDNQGHMIGTHTSTTDYTYDTDGNLIRYDMDDGSTSTTTYTYDEHGNLLTENWIYNDGQDVATHTYENIYDEHGNLIKQINTYDSTINGQGTTVKEYDYDEYGNKIAYYINGRQMDTYSYTDPNWKANKAHRDWLARRKLIYTVAEAEKLSKPTGNKFRIRYK